MVLASILDSHRVIVCVGSGGVGKTTTSAALAVEAARRGRTVLCLTIDPAKRLANSLGLGEMRLDAQEVPRALFEQNGITSTGELYAMMLDTKRTFDELVEKHASSPAARDRVLHNTIYQYVSTSLAGTREYMAMEKLHAVRADPRWDLIVLDTPPTSNALDFLEAPERLASMIDSPAMRWFLRAIEGGGRLSLRLLNRGARMVLSGLARFTGASFLEQVAEFVSGVDDLFGGFRERAERVAADLRQPDVAFLIITGPTQFRMEEGLFLRQRLEEAGLRAAAIVVNAVHPALDAAPLTDEELATELRRAVPSFPADGPMITAMRRTWEQEAFRGRADRASVASLVGSMHGGVPLVEAPAFEEDIHDLAGLAKLARHLVTETPRAPALPPVREQKIGGAP